MCYLFCVVNASSHLFLGLPMFSRDLADYSDTLQKYLPNPGNYKLLFFFFRHHLVNDKKLNHVSKINVDELHSH